MNARIHLVRHAKAKNRAEWTERDDLRPLTKRGRREAAALAERLGAEDLVRLVSSPFVRCVQTLGPLAEALDAHHQAADAIGSGVDPLVRQVEDRLDPIRSAVDAVREAAGRVGLPFA